MSRTKKRSPGAGKITYLVTPLDVLARMDSLRVKWGTPIPIVRMAAIRLGLDALEKLEAQGVTAGEAFGLARVGTEGYFLNVARVGRPATSSP